MQAPLSHPATLEAACTARQAIQLRWPPTSTDGLSHNVDHPTTDGVPELINTLQDPVTGERETLVPFFVDRQAIATDQQPIGWLRPCVVDALMEYCALRSARALDNSENGPGPFYFARCPTELRSGGQRAVRAVSFSDAINLGGRGSRTEAMESLISHWRNTGLFPDKFKHWRADSMTVYRGSPQRSSDSAHSAQSSRHEPDKEEALFDIRKCAAYIFGLSMYGVHMTAFKRDPANGAYTIVIAKRGRNKRLYPGMLDNAVGGSIDQNEGRLQALLRECYEEANLSRQEVIPRLTELSDFYLPLSFRHSSGWMHRVQLFAYELNLSSITVSQAEGSSSDTKLGSLAFTPGGDGDEVEGFIEMTPEDVIEGLKQGAFTPPSGLVMLDFIDRYRLAAIEEYSSIAASLLPLKRVSTTA